MTTHEIRVDYTRPLLATVRREVGEWPGSSSTQSSPVVSSPPSTTVYVGQRRFVPTPCFLDAEEVRGSNPLAPTSKGPGHRPFSFEPAEPIDGLEAKKLTKS